MEVYENIIKKINLVTVQIVHGPLNVKELPEYKEVNADLLAHIMNNLLYVSDDLMNSLTQLQFLDFEEVDKEKIKKFIELRARIIKIMRSELGLSTIHQKFAEMFPEMEIINPNSK